MVNERGFEFLKRIHDIPTAAFYEQWVHDELKEIYKDTFSEHEKVSMHEDPYGNLYFHYKGDSDRNQPKSVAFVVHTDHPAYHLTPLSDGTVQVRMMGGLEKDLTLGTKLSLHHSKKGKGHVGTGKVIKELDIEKENPSKRFIAEVEGEDNDYNFATIYFEQEAPEVGEDKMLRARILDDFAGIAMSLASFEEIVKQDLNLDAYVVFHRAEEVGLLGAYIFAKQEIMPKDTFVISVETSSYKKEKPSKEGKAEYDLTAEVGGGAILRTGDRRSAAYDLSAVSWLHYAGLHFEGKLQERRMGAGTCEASVYYAFGYRAVGVCVPVVGWHNNGKFKGEHSFILEEVHEDDFNSAIDFMTFSSKFLAENPLLYKRFGVQDIHEMHHDLLKELGKEFLIHEKEGDWSCK